jgi:hypothetical protein
MNDAAAAQASASVPCRRPEAETKAEASSPTLAAVTSSMAAFRNCERTGDQSTIICASQI